MKIRLMCINDYEQVFSVWSGTQGMGMRSLDDSYQGIQNFLKRNPNTNFVAEDEGKIIGVLLCGHDGRRAYIYHMAICEEQRRRGLGKKLVEKTISALHKEGIHKAALVVFSSNELGNAFWEAIGFTKRDDLVYRNKSINDQNF